METTDRLRGTWIEVVSPSGVQGLRDAEDEFSRWMVNGAERSDQPDSLAAQNQQEIILQTLRTL